jgi:hypothetical protein
MSKNNKEQFSTEQMRQIGGLLMFIGAPILLFTGISDLLSVIFVPPTPTSDPLIIYLNFIHPCIFLFLGLIASVSAGKSVLSNSVRGYWLIGTLVAVFWRILDRILYLIFIRRYDLIFFRLGLFNFIIVVFLLQCCPMVVGVFLIYRYRDLE